MICIFVKEVTIEGTVLYFIRIADRVAWSFSIAKEKKSFGDFVKVMDEDEQTIRDAFEILVDQAIDTMARLFLLQQSQSEVTEQVKKHISESL